jgi:hypothetical protein
MRIRQRARRPGVGLYLFLAGALAAPSWARGAEPSETIRAAFRASSEGLTSGTGNGRYRRYEAVTGDDWQLKVEADVSTHFDGSKYHIDLTFLHDDLRRNTSSRIICDGKLVTITWFSPDIHPLGAHTIVSAPARFGDILCQPEDATFSWDVAHLSGHVWNGQRLIYDVDAGRIDFTEKPDGDLVGTNPIVINRSQIRMECPRRFGFNIARAEFSVAGEKHPRREYVLQWKQHPSGLWYLMSLQQIFELRSDLDKVIKRVREVLMYSRFEPNARVESSLFTEESLQMPDGCRIIEIRPGERSKERIYRKR